MRKWHPGYMHIKGSYVSEICLHLFLVIWSICTEINVVCICSICSRFASHWFWVYQWLFCKNVSHHFITLNYHAVWLTNWSKQFKSICLHWVISMWRGTKSMHGLRTDWVYKALDQNITGTHLPSITNMWRACKEPKGYWRTTPTQPQPAAVEVKRHRSICCYTNKLQSSSLVSAAD